MSRRDSVAGTAADPTLESAPLEIDGKAYRLIWDFNAIAEAEAIAREEGAPISLLHGIASVLVNDATAGQLRGLLWAALRKHHREMTVTTKRLPKDKPVSTLLKAGALFRIDTMEDIREALLRAWNASMPEGKKFLKENPPEGAPPAAPES